MALEVTLLPEGDHLFRYGTEFLGLGVGGRYPLMAQEGCHHVPEHGYPVTRGSTQPSSGFIVTHDNWFLSLIYP
jgi:hypothetical protein